MSGPAPRERGAPPEPGLLDQARSSYETHVRTCARCADDDRPCSAAELLKRTYDNFQRAARRSRGTGSGTPS
uniref:hypothetical protein n=1 Tax=Streptomyces sp. SAT1 TaxID=1849967 RepID=UPI0007F983DC|nr:hypothetical protein [Streptomyces sp. SAT1]ANO42310.1 hypothetical protein A8713_034195 [Streptomyces sp. SAT1]